MDPWKLDPAHDLGLSEADRLKSLRRESGLLSTGLHFAWWSAVRCYMATWHRLKIIGREHLPQAPPFVLVANHVSHLDALVLASPLPWQIRDRIFPVAAGDVFFRTPIASVFAATFLNALPMWRKNCGPHALAQLRQRLLEEPCSYILFPEGTRSRDGTLSRFKPGLGMLVAETSVPVVPCHLSGCFEALPPNRALPRPKKIVLRIGEPTIFRDVCNHRDGWMQIARTLEDRVQSLATAT